MKIRALRLAEVGQFRDPIAVEGFSGGLDVLAGPNELGKSTLFRAIRAVLLTRHTTVGRAVDEMATRGGARSPRIEADFEAQGQLWRITKTYGRGKSAELLDLETGRARARGADAEAKLSELIGVDGADEAAGRFGLLFVGQQKSLVAPTPDGDPDHRKFYGGGERATLEGAIASEVDTVAGGARARRIADRVMGELETYLQPKRRAPKKGSRYEAALQQRAALNVRREHLRVEQTKAVARLDRLAVLMRQQAEEASPQVLVGLQRAKEAAEKSLAEGEKLANALAQALSQETAARLSLESAGERLHQYGKALDDVRVLALETVGLDEEEPRTEAARQSRSDELGQIDAQIGALETRLVHVAQEAERARRAQSLRHTIAAQQAAHQRADTLVREIAGFEAAFAKNPATPERMRHLSEAVQAATLATERAGRSAGVDLSFALEAGAVARVRINGEPACASGRIGVTESVTVEIEGIGRFEVIPADGAERAMRRVEAETAQAKVAAIEGELGVPSGEAAHALADQRQALGEALMRAKAQLQAAAPEGVDLIARKIAADQQALAALESQGEGAQELKIDVADGEELHRTLAAEVRAVRMRRDDVIKALRDHEFAMQRIAERRADIGKRLAACADVVGPEAGRSAERDRLAVLRDEAEAALKSALQERTVLSQSAPSAEQVGTLRATNAAANAALRQAEASATRLAQEIAALEGEIRAAGEAEIGPEIARLDGESAALDTQIAHHEREIAALELLRDTLGAVAADNRSRFLLPVMTRLQPYLAQVFANAEVVLGEDFALQALSRGGHGEPIDLLSDGTREQLAVLVRLGFGRLIADTGRPAPVILDDALVFSDDQRIARMFKALQSASQHHQVIIFTCREATFAPLGGTRLKIASWQP